MNNGNELRRKMQIEIDKLSAEVSNFGEVLLNFSLSFFSVALIRCSERYPE